MYLRGARSYETLYRNENKNRIYLDKEDSVHVYTP